MNIRTPKFRKPHKNCHRSILESLEPRELPAKLSFHPLVEVGRTTHNTKEVIQEQHVQSDWLTLENNHVVVPSKTTTNTHKNIAVHAHSSKINTRISSLEKSHHITQLHIKRNLPPPIESSRVQENRSPHSSLVSAEADSGGSPAYFTLQNNNSGGEYRGSPASYTLFVDSGHTIINVDWDSNDIVDGLQTPDVADGTLVYPKTLVSQNHSATIQGFWGPSGGSSESLGATVLVEENVTGIRSTPHVSFTRTLLPVTITLNITSLNYASFVTIGGSPALAYQGSGAGIRWTTSADVGDTQTLQVIRSGSAYETATTPIPGGSNYTSFQHYTPDHILVSASYNLVDVPSGTASPWYPYFSDSPSIPLVAGMNNAIYNASFQDYVFNRPPGGIWVPHTIWGWQISMTASNTSGSWTSSSTTVSLDVIPGSINATYDPAVPFWVDSIVNWKAIVAVPNGA